MHTVDVGETSAKKKEERFLANVAHKPMFCPLHNDEKLNFFCETCKALICRDCIVLEHAGHKYDRIEKVAEKEKHDLLSVLGDAEAAKASIEDVLAQVEKMMQSVQAISEAIPLVSGSVEKLHCTLHAIGPTQWDGEPQLLVTSK